MLEDFGYRDEGLGLPEGMNELALNVYAELLCPFQQSPGRKGLQPGRSSSGLVAGIIPTSDTLA
jgi:hypothetical protein